MESMQKQECEESICPAGVIIGTYYDTYYSATVPMKNVIYTWYILRRVFVS